MKKRTGQLFSMLESFCEYKEVKTSNITNTFYRFCVLFRDMKIETVKKIKKYHIKLFCYLLDKYSGISSKCINDLTDDEIETIFFLLLVHVIEEDYEYGTYLIGKGKCKNVLKINDILYKFIFSINNDNEIVTLFWNNLNDQMEKLKLQSNFVNPLND